MSFGLGRRVAVALSLAVASSLCFAADACTAPQEFQPRLCPVKLPAIASVQIQENGAKSPAETDPAVDCKAFRLTTTQVRRFFAQAMSADESDAHHTLDWSPCHAGGTLTFKNGRTAEWRISQARTGSLSMNDTAQPDGVQRLFLYCPRCTRAPFD